MKKLVLGVVATMMVLASCNNGGGASGDIELIDLNDSMSYALGCLISDNNQKNFDDDIDIDIFLAAIKEHSDSNADLLIPFDEAEMILKAYAYKKSNAIADKTMADGMAFLENNKTQEGVVTLESGVQYKVLKAGTGPQPTLEDTVICHYTGTFIDGKVFDSSVERGEPAKFTVNGVIRGWQQIVPMMPVGSKWMVYIPSNMAYGSKDSQGMPANSTLIFEIELLEIVK